MWVARSADQGAVVNSSYVYGNNISFRDIISGNNGASALTGYDLVTGRGSFSQARPTVVATGAHPSERRWVVPRPVKARP
jgi:hypothetical protein